MIKILTVLFVIVISVALFINLKHKSQVNKSEKVTSDLKLKKVVDIPFSGGTDRWDYQSINYENNRLYISHLGSNMVSVFDLKNQSMIQNIPLSSSPYGILVVPKLNMIYVGVGGNNSVAVIDEKSLKVIKYIRAGETPDGLTYDPNTSKVFVSNENGGTVTVIDSKTNERIEDIPVGDSVGNVHYDQSSEYIYTVSGNDNALLEIAPYTDKVIEKYNLKGCSHPHGFYIEDQTHYALITCQGNSKIVIFDLNTKQVIRQDTVGRNPDVLAYDQGLHRLYIASESGSISIFQVSQNNVKKISEGFLADNAHTVSVDSRTNKVYFPLENVNGKPVLRIMQPKQ